jgi:hypothetical protein
MKHSLFILLASFLFNSFLYGHGHNIDRPLTRDEIRKRKIAKLQREYNQREERRKQEEEEQERKDKENRENDPNFDSKSAKDYTECITENNAQYDKQAKRCEAMKDNERYKTCSEGARQDRREGKESCERVQHSDNIREVFTRETKDNDKLHEKGHD